MFVYCGYMHKHTRVFVCVSHDNHSPHNYHFLLNGSDLLITILPCVCVRVFVCVCVKKKREKENETAG